MAQEPTMQSNELALQSNEISLRDFLELLRRRKAIVIQTFVIVVAIGAILTFVSKPIYRSVTRILVEGKSLKLAQYDANNPLSNIFVTDPGHDVATQIEVLQSENVLADACKDAGIPVDAVRGFGRSVKLDVKQVETTDVIEISAESTNADYAEKLTRTIPNTYLRYVTGNSKDEIKQALDFATTRLDQENRRLLQIEMAMERFKKRHKLTNLDTERSQRIIDSINAEGEARRSQAQVASNQARLDSLIAARDSLPAFLEAPTTATNNLQIDAQKEKIAGLQSDRAKLLPLYKPNSVEVQKVDAQIAEQQKRLAELPATVTTVTRAPNPSIITYNDKITEAQATLIASTAERTESRARAAHLAAGLGRFSSVERQQAELQRNLDMRSNMVTMLSKSVEDLSLREKATHNPVTTITAASPAIQVAPRKANNLIFASLLGMLLGIGFALLQEFLDDRINSLEEGRLVLGAPALGYVPLIEREDRRLITQDNTGGSLLESYRVLRSNVQFATVDAPLASVMVTSTVPGEGKSVTACNLAVAMALDGRRVILVDADLHRPTIHSKFHVNQQPGLTNVLVGRTLLERALQETSVPGLRVLAAGPLPPNPAELLNSQAMRLLHAELKEHADIVIFDSPPCLATADAQVLSAVVDGVLYVVQFGETKKSAIRHSVELLRQAHARVLGMVFNKIDLSSRSNSYYYGYYGHYQQHGSEEIGDQRRRRTHADFEALVAKNGSEEPIEKGVIARVDEDKKEGR